MPDACIAVIPARGGSKRVPGKNIKPLMGKPLIAYTVEAAADSGLFGRIVVSTDCPEIAEVAQRHGAEVPFLREASLADDITPVSAATVDMLVKLDPDGSSYGFVCQMMPNCPLKTSADVRDSHRQFLESGADSQLSVVRYGWQNPWWAMRRDDSFRLDPLFREAMTQRSQDLPELFCPTGAIWWAKADVLRREGTYHIPAKTGWEIPWQRGLDIDTYDDWDMAEILFRLDSAGRR
ncbi:cytidylyltransferase domain-containing protein [Geobacter sulfurreducens]|uniref:acylneuraminate cytidylyltransferase family protein n=1 Tax=Geobacter sulfurreducens TaxID=35554 RepID=UPI0020B6D574|nr:acylneuraminate cytidylyltransferase family protein [Geobacter sulfurreducens]UTG91429.1 acylneuraminate cytidylyltransferase family protein [Geobacter sulfurreducens]